MAAEVKMSQWNVIHCYTVNKRLGLGQQYMNFTFGVFLNSLVIFLCFKELVSGSLVCFGVYSRGWTRLEPMWRRNWATVFVDSISVGVEKTGNRLGLLWRRERLRRLCCLRRR